MQQADDFHASYAAALQRYLATPDERSLCAAYELGREAVAREIAIHELATAHHESLLSCLLAARSADDAEPVTRAAGEFFLESLSAFEMVRSGFYETRDLALLERRHAALLRQLSNFLADGSLTLNTPDVLHEVLTLVAEHARELIGADGVLAEVRLRYGVEPVTVASISQSVSGPAEPPSETLLLDRRAVPSGGRTGDACAETTLPAGASVESSDPMAPYPSRGWLTVPLTALDGREIGSIHVFDKRDGGCTALHEAVLAHVAEMASAAIERASLYDRPGHPRGARPA